jgi:hypothetical protein
LFSTESILHDEFDRGLNTFLPRVAGGGVTVKNWSDALVLAISYVLLNTGIKGKVMDPALEHLLISFVNFSPLLNEVGVAASEKMMQMVAKLGTRGFLEVDRMNWRSLAWCLEGLSLALTHHWRGNSNLVYAMVMHSHTFESISNLNTENGQNLPNFVPTISKIKPLLESANDTTHMQEMIVETNADVPKVTPVNRPFVFGRVLRGWMMAQTWSLCYRKSIGESYTHPRFPGLWNGTEVRLFEIRDDSS